MATDLARARSGDRTGRTRLTGLCPSMLVALIAFISRELRVYRLMARHPRTPRGSKILLWVAVAYAVWPLGLVPDLIPIVGYVDDVIIVPILVFIAVRRVSREVVTECRSRAGPVAGGGEGGRLSPVSPQAC